MAAKADRGSRRHRERERRKKEKNKQPEKKKTHTHTQRCQAEFKSIKKYSHKGVTALSASALDAECGNTFVTTLPVSTNIGLALGSHTETPARACVRSTVRAAGGKRGTLALYIDVMKGRGSRRFEEREDGGRRSRREFRGGEHGEIKAAFQSQSLVGLFESWWLSAGMRTNIDKCDTGSGLHAKLCR